MVNSLESQTEEDERKKQNIPLQPPTNRVWSELDACKHNVSGA